MFSVLVLIVCFLSVWLEYNTFSIIIMFVKYLLCTKLNIAEVVYMLKAMALHNHLCCQIIDNFAIFDSSSSFCMKKNKYLFLSLIYNLRRVILEINLICSNSWTHKCLSWLVVILFSNSGWRNSLQNLRQILQTVLTSCSFQCMPDQPPQKLSKTTSVLLNPWLTPTLYSMLKR